MGRPEAPSALPCNQQWPRHSATGTQGRCCRMLTGCGSHSRPTSSTPNRTHPPTSGAGRGVGPPPTPRRPNHSREHPVVPHRRFAPHHPSPRMCGQPHSPQFQRCTAAKPPPLPPRAGALRPPCGAKRPPRYPECRSPNRRDPKPGRGRPPSPPPYPTTASWAPPLTAPQRTPGPHCTSLSPTRPDLTPGPTPHLPQPHSPTRPPAAPPRPPARGSAIPPYPRGRRCCRCCPPIRAPPPPSCRLPRPPSPRARPRPLGTTHGGGRGGAPARPRPLGMRGWKGGRDRSGRMRGMRAT